MANYEKQPELTTAWKLAYKKGIASELADRVIKERAVPDKLLAVLGSEIVHRPYKIEYKDTGEIFKLTQRQREVLFLASCGWSQRHISQALNIDMQTTKTHMSKILKRLDARNVTQAVAIGIRIHEIV